MLHLPLGKNLSRNCEGATRRDLLRVGALSFFGMALPEWLQLRAANASTAPVARAEAVILLWCAGAPSHLDSFDPKPNAPSEVRGEFVAIETNVPGVQLCEHLPLTAKVMNQVALVRSLTSAIAAHEQASQYLLTGYRPLPTLEYPNYGSVVSKELGGRNNLPAYVAVPDAGRAGGAGFLGAGYNPFTAPDPVSPGFRVPNIVAPASVDADRLAKRRAFTERMNGRFTVGLPDENVRSVDRFYENAYDLVTSGAAQKAFDLNQETPATRDRYGRTTMGQGALLARRLVEAGTRFVTVSRGGWDTHQNNFATLQQRLLPELDRAYAMLLTDLQERGLLQKTLVILMGEFGRTPRINARGGRDHWSRCRFAAFAGAGMRGGQVIGASDAHGGVPTERPVSVEDVAMTLYAALGIDPEKQYRTPAGRPIHLATGGEVIRELWG